MPWRLHEIGHTIGLAHHPLPEDRSEIMNFATIFPAVTDLGDGDIAAVQTIYTARTATMLSSHTPDYTSDGGGGGGGGALGLMLGLGLIALLAGLFYRRRRRGRGDGSRPGGSPTSR